MGPRRRGGRSIVLGVPQTYPPPAIQGELVGDLQVDVRNFRSDDRDRILTEVYAMTEQHFAVARQLLDTRPWDLFFMVEIGLDRLHHAFWRYTDPAHPRYTPDHRFAGVIKGYYQYLDDEIGELLERFDEDTAVLVVSDHGARPMEGAICVNDWLVREGYLVLAAPVAPGRRCARRRSTGRGRARGRRG